MTYQTVVLPITSSDPNHLQTTPVFKFLVLLHIFGMDEDTVVKFSA